MSKHIKVEHVDCATCPAKVPKSEQSEHCKACVAEIKAAIVKLRKEAGRAEGVSTRPQRETQSVEPYGRRVHRGPPRRAGRLGQ